MKFLDTTMSVFAYGVRRYHTEDHQYMILRDPVRGSHWQVSGPNVDLDWASSLEDAKNIVRRACGVPQKVKAASVAERLIARLRDEGVALSEQAQCLRERQGDGLAWTWFVHDPKNIGLCVGSYETMTNCVKADKLVIHAPDRHKSQDVEIVGGSRS